MASKYRKKFTVPENFQEFLADYTREVLRDQPQDIVEFSYLYFKAIEEVSTQLQNLIWEGISQIITAHFDVVTHR